MREETKENLKRVLLSCVPEGMRWIIEKKELENLKIQIQDRKNPMHRASYRFAPYEGKFIEQTGMSNYKHMYEPEEFVKTVEELKYLVNVKIAA